MVGLGIGLAGYGEALPQIQQMQAMQQQKGQQAALAKALQGYAAQRGGAAGAPGMPGQAQMAPQDMSAGVTPFTGPKITGDGPPVPSPNTQAPPTMPPPGGGSPGAPGGGFSGGLPPLDQMISMLSNSGLAPDQQYEALMKYGAFASPFEKMQQQLEMKSTQMQFQSQMLDERLKEMDRLGVLHANTSSSNTDKRVGAEERGQDLNAAAKDKSADVAADRNERVDLRGELTTITQRLSNDFNLTSDQRAELSKQWDDTKAKLDSKRQSAGLPVARDKKPTPTGGAPNASTSGAAGVPVPQEAQSFPDGTRIPDNTGKIWIKKDDQLVPSE